MDNADNTSMMILLGEMKGDVKSILASIHSTNQRVEKVENRVDHNDLRLSDLEKSKAWAKGAIALIVAISAGIGTTIGLVLNFIKH